MTLSHDFLDVPPVATEAAEVLLLPLPFEATVSYGGGTAGAPEAIWAASTQVELFEELTGVDLSEVKFHTADPVEWAAGESVGAYLKKVEMSARRLHAIADGARSERAGSSGGDSGGSTGGRPLVIGVGGEHSLTPALVRAAAGGGELSDWTVVQFDAHADLRAEYQGSPHSHACAMRPLVEAGAQVVCLGLRSADVDEYEYGIASGRVTYFHAHTLTGHATAWGDGGGLAAAREHLRGLTGPVYVTFDIDGLDVHLCPSTGTPEPGGLSWWSALTLLHALLNENPSLDLRGLDLMETVPSDALAVNAFTAAKLLSKMIAFARAT